ncbi:MAG: DNA polymerase subunit beta [Nitrospirae bacterium CG_4_10_14_3_um_filter_44_29]|nr:nucleotidyltransferase domain-containing protein [Nitrospirota bacterium]PIV40243.1 MAG: DNA polymerase subunit beta [Nitrospirae bacterium CG02_land_8_20_14_3_00_44_33]PIV66921.1 MAG: DNA polymerase subunit beta [Nitrospirae bacterium CG01_land_8_20_14_3_00_44_22]PIW90597.1 MAG: DNA polymerase subunit beta [Nitrospirae bacterium CG_4_8_14_3_um_filter_44_28]PIX87885.1 MAG: DNA polymerase subunit beta [Nitrospirae bacterium CG_4_10_14_3_um_filter_44_29]
MDYTAAWKIRLSDDERMRLSLFHKARTAAEKAAQVLVEEFGAGQVYLIGSLLKEDIFTEYSDVDIAVSGLKTERYFRALSAIWGLFPKGMEVDLIPLEDADEYIRSKIFYEGVLLHDKERTVRT